MMKKNRHKTSNTHSYFDSLMHNTGFAKINNLLIIFLIIIIYMMYLMCQLTFIIVLLWS